MRAILARHHVATKMNADGVPTGLAPVTASSGPGNTERPRSGRGSRLRWLRQSLAARLALLALVFLAVPVLIYDQLRRADETTQALLLESAQSQGSLIARALEPGLERANATMLPHLGAELQRFADDRTRLSLLVRPRAMTGEEGFFYVASAPPVPTEFLESEHRKLLEQGVLHKLGGSCEGNAPLALRVPQSSGGFEIMTSVTPINATFGCWALITSHSADGYLKSALGRPYWRTPVVQIAAVIYLGMAVLAMAVLLGAWRNLLRFGTLARSIVSGGIDSSERAVGGSFTQRNTVPELAGVAEDFDRLVDTLRNSARSLRRAAEDNAHAFKTPIAVIRQSVEPLRRSAPPDNLRSHRAIGLIEASLDKLDGLVSFARRMDEAAADLLAPPRWRINFSDLVERMAAGYTGILAERRLHMRSRIETGLIVLANEDVLETVIENLVENAVSFSPDDGAIAIRLYRNARHVELTVEDEGVGVDPGNLPLIFERYFTQRSPGRGMPEDEAKQHQAAATHYGIGLWIVRRNIEAFGGTVVAENREQGGLRVKVLLPLS